MLPEKKQPPWMDKTILNKNGQEKSRQLVHRLFVLYVWELNDTRADLNTLKPHFELLRARAVFHGYFFGDTTIIN